MHSLFTAIVIISSAVVGILIYYFIKHIVEKNKYKYRIQQIRKKMYEDDRILLMNRLRFLIPKIKSGEIRWIIISSKANRSIHLELIYSSIKMELELHDRGNKRTDHEVLKLKKLGASSFHSHADLQISYIPLNSKIVTDIIYFTLENIFKYKPAQNLKISTSGDS